ncbi:hypothetical protein [Azohydromonas caseinilytica]|nr:hypothetical protein [Azohydromonas caseinilytica]
MNMLLELVVLLAACGAALYFRPWATLRAADLRHPWLASLVLLPWVWSFQSVLPGGPPLQLSCAALLVLMFGWPLAVLSCVPVAICTALIDASGAQAALHQAVWNGVLPATMALGLGIVTRRWLPQHLMVYILARGFGATLLAMALVGVLWLLRHPLPPGSDVAAVLTGRWLVAWSDAVLSGMLCAIFVAWRPQWLLTYSDRRYLPVAPR